MKTVKIPLYKFPAVIGIFYKDYYEASKHLKKGFEVLPCDKGFLIVNSKYLSTAQQDNANIGTE